MLPGVTIQLLVPNTYGIYFLELASLPLLILSFVVIIRSHVTGLLRRIYNGVLVFFTGIILFQWIANFFFKIDLRLTLWMTHE
jgi:hypothetical protein